MITHVRDSSELTGVVVVGAGAAAAPPDVVRINLAAEATADEVQAALVEATNALSRMRSVLAGSGIPPGDLRTTDMNAPMRWRKPGSMRRSPVESLVWSSRLTTPDPVGQSRCQGEWPRCRWRTLAWREGCRRCQPAWSFVGRGPEVRYSSPSRPER
jgi:Protein of unknown function (DUF541)